MGKKGRRPKPYKPNRHAMVTVNPAMLEHARKQRGGGPDDDDGAAAGPGSGAPGAAGGASRGRAQQYAADPRLPTALARLYRLAVARRTKLSVAFVDTAERAREVAKTLSALDVPAFALAASSSVPHAAKAVAKTRTAPDGRLVLVVADTQLKCLKAIPPPPKGHVLSVWLLDEAGGGGGGGGGTGGTGGKRAAAAERWADRANVAVRAVEVAGGSGGGDAAVAPCDAADAAALVGRVNAAREVVAAASGASAAAAADPNRLAALRRRLQTALSTKLPSEASVTDTSAVASTDGARATRRKLRLLGMLDAAGSAALGGGLTRDCARTRWLDGATGASAGGAWAGSIRDGATREPTSDSVRAALSALVPAWNPSPRGADEAADAAAASASAAAAADAAPGANWGGRFGKACAHNEVVMHMLRPDAPMEVLNTRVCCKAKPAPGNDGYDGCLEFMALRCKSRKRCACVMDVETVYFFTAAGAVDALPKAELLSHPWRRLKVLWPAVCAWIVAADGQAPPRALLEAVAWTATLLDPARRESSLRTALSGRLLGPRASRLVAEFAVGPGAWF